MPYPPRSLSKTGLTIKELLRGSSHLLSIYVSDIMTDTETLQQPNKEDISLLLQRNWLRKWKESNICAMFYAYWGLFLKIFWCGAFLRSFLNLLTILFLFCFFFLMFWFFGPEVYGILVPQPGIALAPPALEGKLLTTGLPWKFLFVFKVWKSIKVVYTQAN